MTTKKQQQKKEAVAATPQSADLPVMRVLAALGAEFGKRGKTTVVLKLPDGSQFVWFKTDVMTLAMEQIAKDHQEKPQP